jgi:hypothetical protein
MTNNQHFDVQPTMALTPDQQMALINTYLNGNATAQLAGCFINLTAMCRVFGKHAGHYLALRQSKEFIQFWARETGVETDSLVVKVKGAKPTAKPIAWAHRRIAFECALWLSVHFRLWYYHVTLYPGPQFSAYEEVLRALADQVAAEARGAAKRLKELECWTDPNRIPGLPWPRRRVGRVAIEEA